MTARLHALRPMKEAIPPPADRDLGKVTQLVFFALHGNKEWDFPSTDTKILKHYAASLPIWARLWALQYREESASTRMEVSEKVSRFIGAGACSWGRTALKTIFPLLMHRTQDANTHPG